MPFDKKRFIEGAGNSARNFTLKGSRGGGVHITGKQNLFSLADRGIMRNDAKTTNKGSSGSAVRDMLSEMSKHIDKGYEVKK